ncbi:MAG: GDP-L-fucose synthase [Oligoflexia bacterium]|nr:GDP-L-fucose synthase [Oligoflexia bacterium]
MSDTKSWNVKNPVLYNDFKNLKITVTGGNGFLGRHLVAQLIERGAQKENIYCPTSRECDLRKPQDAAQAVKNKDLVIHLAARVGGIGLNQKCPADLIYDNATMGINVIHESHKAKVKKIVVAGTVCAYPKFTPVPFKEEDLWNGYPEETNAPYGVAKKLLLVALQSYRQQYNLSGIFLLPANLYGPHDNFDLESSHVIPAMIRKFVEARTNETPTVTLWGDGSPSREFLYVEDCARGIIEATLKYDGPEAINLGTHEETQIKYLAETVKDLVGYSGLIQWDTNRPNGQPKRQLDVSRAVEAFNFKAQVTLRDGLKKTIDWYAENKL